jgi:hypothetical protein
MRKILALLVGSFLSIGVLAAGSGWFSSLLPSFFSSDKEDILTYVPADTAYYLGGDSAENLTEIMGSFSVLESSPRISSWLSESLVTLNEYDSPEAKFFTYFLGQYKSANESGLVDLAKLTGIPLTGSYAVFSDGFFPVVRINVGNVDAVDALIENAVKDSGWQYNWENIGEEKVRSWTMGEGDENEKMYFTVLNNENGVVITFISSKDELEKKQKRLGITKPESSLATNGTIEALKKQYNYTSDMIGFIQIDRIADAFLFPEESRLGRDLVEFFPKREMFQIQRELLPECRAEYSKLVAAVPRFVTGYQVFESDSQSASYKTHSVLELKNEAVSLSLQNAQGYLPVHSTVLDDKLFAFGLGASSDDLGKELLSLLVKFQNTEFKCSPLQDMKEDIARAVPAELLDEVSVGRGMKGIGVSLFNLKMKENSALPESIDFLISVASEDPAALFEQVKNFPLTPQITLPENGSEVSLDLPVETDFDVKAAIKGKHLVVFSGEHSTLLANELVTEPISNNGLVSISANFHKLGELLGSDELNPLLAKTHTDDACTMKYELAHMFQSLDMKSRFVMKVDQAGITTTSDSYFDKTKPARFDLAGTYQLVFIDQDEECDVNGVTISKDLIKEDGTGVYSSRDEEDMCDLYVSNYSWKQQGHSLLINGQGQERMSCDVALSEPEPEDFNCYLINNKDGDFSCLYYYDGYASVEKYRRIVD